MTRIWIFLVVSVIGVSSDSDMKIFKRTVTTPGCPTGWMAFYGKCYFFSHMTETFSGASAFCQSFNSILAEPKTNTEIGYLSGEIILIGVTDYWVGISDVIQDNHWIYHSSLTPVQLHNWGPHEPSGGHCLVMSGYFHGKYADVDCKTQRRFICERYATLQGTLIG
ncbi:C-type lectin domain family 17, member A-like [Ostrea edulis]|uniref:C-type lectin domain family 17, member A-like n=1 Tax=Ostrea edulis TaxID=37623 RepID=UPI00209589B0|nr:C-type lectin domain family 17, member A-like [Ostrea edulis]